MPTTKQLKIQASRRMSKKWIEEIKAKATSDAWVSVAKTAVQTSLKATADFEAQKAFELAQGRVETIKPPHNRFLVNVPDYYACSGGSRTMHYLAALLVDVGVQVATNRLCYFNPTIPVVQKAAPGDIAIYFDGVRSTANPFGARRICRWMLCYAEE